MWQSYFPTVTTGDDLLEAVTSDRLSSLQRVAEDVTRGGQIRGMGGVRVRTYNGETTVAVERFRRRLWMGRGGTAATTLYPWDGEMETSTLFRFTRAGSVNSAGIPTNMISGGVYLGVTTGALTYIKLDVTTDGEVPTSCEISSSGSPASPVGISTSIAPLSFSLDLWVVVSGVAFKIVGNSNVSAYPYIVSSTDSGGVACGENPWVHTWSWIYSS